MVIWASPDRGSQDIIFSLKMSWYHPNCVRLYFVSLPNGPSACPSGMIICDRRRLAFLSGDCTVTCIFFASLLIKNILVCSPLLWWIVRFSVWVPLKSSVYSLADLVRVFVSGGCTSPVSITCCDGSDDVIVQPVRITTGNNINSNILFIMIRRVKWWDLWPKHRP